MVKYIHMCVEYSPWNRISTTKIKQYLKKKTKKWSSFIVKGISNAILVGVIVGIILEENGPGLYKHRFLEIPIIGIFSIKKKQFNLHWIEATEM